LQDIVIQYNICEKNYNPLIFNILIFLCFFAFFSPKFIIFALFLTKKKALFAKYSNKTLCFNKLQQKIEVCQID